MSECEVCGADSYGAPTCSTCEWQQRAEKAEADLVESQRNGALEAIARKKAEAEHLRLRNYVQTTLDCSYGETGGGIHCPLETPCDKCKREKAEAERDEARAEVARLQDLHARCAAFDDQPGPSCVTLAAEVARLREALGSMKHLMGWFWDEGMLDLHDEDCPHDDTCECDAAGQFNEAHAMARAALAGTSDEWLRAFALKCIRLGAYRCQFADFNEDEIVEEVCK